MKLKSVVDTDDFVILVFKIIPIKAAKFVILLKVVNASVFLFNLVLESFDVCDKSRDRRRGPRFIVGSLKPSFKNLIPRLGVFQLGRQLIGVGMGRS